MAALLLATPLFMAYEADLPVYQNEECWLKFEYEHRSDTLTNKSFAYHENSTDTVWVLVRIMGFPSEQDRIIPLKQVPTGNHDAISGEHYIPFDDAELLQKYYFIPKGEIEREIPIVLKRTPSLKEADYTLRLTFGTNESFSPGSKETIHKRIVIADQLIQPNSWQSYFLGIYGQEKHRFMIRTTGFKWDDEFMDDVWMYYMQYDQNYCFYLVGVLNKALSEYEAEHGRLYEADGVTPVDFPKF